MKSPSDEVQWTDDSIRWEGGLHGDIKQEEGSDDDEDCMIDPLQVSVHYMQMMCRC